MKEKFLQSHALKEGEARYGKPWSDDYFVLENRNLTESRIELLNSFTGEELPVALCIMEVNWSYNGQQNITKWFLKRKQGFWEEVSDLV